MGKDIQRLKGNCCTEVVYVAMYVTIADDLSGICLAPIPRYGVISVPKLDTSTSHFFQVLCKVLKRC